ncbi:MAG: ABC transporter permease subunit, partial [Bryobacteraceae bacterium]
MTLHGLSRSVIRDRTWNFFMDAIVFASLFAIGYAVVSVARYWFSTPVAAVEISLAPTAIPRYAFYSLVRMIVAYLLSLLFAIAYGYIAAYNRRLEAGMLAVLDILQSIPVLSFLPGVMLAMVSLFPSRQLGVEFGSILLIFTGQVWNMAFSFYASLKALPRELVEASRVYRFGGVQRFLQLELPQGTIGLVWNSMVSVAGGWFFLMACEMFVLGKRDFRLPGLGSYLQSAASAGDTAAIKVESSSAHSSAVLNLLRKSPLLARLRAGVTAPLMERIYSSSARHPAEEQSELSNWQRAWMILAGILALLAILYGVLQGLLLLKGITRPEFLTTLESAGATWLRVIAALAIASAWTIPAGVAIGFNPRLARIAQPLAQIAASVPATALFPVLLLGLISLGGGLNIGSILLMLLGTQWYILFNVIAGAIAIPSEFREVADIFHFGRIERWRTVILPAIFPYLITGLVTASGGAWNASIVAE